MHGDNKPLLCYRTINCGNHNMFCGWCQFVNVLIVDESSSEEHLLNQQRVVVRYIFVITTSMCKLNCFQYPQHVT